MDLPGWRAPALLIAAALVFGLFGSSSASAAKKPPVKVSTGSYHTCAVDQQKHVQCWGYNSYGGRCSRRKIQVRRRRLLLDLRPEDEPEDRLLGLQQQRRGVTPRGRVQISG